MRAARAGINVAGGSRPGWTPLRSRSRGTTSRAAGHLVFELVNPPFGSAAIAGRRALRTEGGPALLTRGSCIRRDDTLQGLARGNLRTLGKGASPVHRILIHVNCDY